MSNSIKEDEIIKTTLESSKTVAMVGVSSIKKEVSTNIKRRPSTIVMKYLQEFGYRVIPVNPTAAGQTIYGETVVSRLEDISIPIDIVDVFRPSKETPAIAEKAAKIGSKVLWLQYGIHNEEAKKISDDSNIKYVSDKCIKQEYQKIFQKSHPVFPVLRNE